MGDDDDDDDDDGELDEYVRTHHGGSIADRGIAGILTMRIQATKFADRPPSC